MWQGVCVAGVYMAGGMHGGFYEIQSMSQWYVSYWNAFLVTTVDDLVTLHKLCHYGEEQNFCL